MRTTTVLRQFMEPLLAGNREGCRAVFREQLARLKDARRICFDLLWPATEQVDKLYRSNQINVASEHMAVRIARCLADQAQAAYLHQDANGKRMVITCADGEPEELGAQMAAALLEIVKRFKV